MEETAAAAAAPVPNAATPAPPEPAGDAPSGDASADPAAVGNDEHDSKEVVLRRYFLQEWELVSAILRRIVAEGGVAEPADVHRIRSIVSNPLPPGLQMFSVSEPCTDLQEKKVQLWKQHLLLFG